MNKCILIAFALLAIIVFVQCNKDDLVVEDTETENEDELNKNNMTKIKKNYLRFKEKYLNSELRKVEKHCSGINEKVEHFEKCVQHLAPLTLCSAAERFILNCTQSLLKVGDECLPERLRGSPILVTKAWLSAVDYLCKETGETIFEFVNPYVWYRWVDVEDDDDEDRIKLENQFEEKIESIKERYRTHVPSQSEVCTDAASLRSCVDELVAPSKSPKTRHAFLGLYDAIVAPCMH